MAAGYAAGAAISTLSVQLVSRRKQNHNREEHSTRIDADAEQGTLIARIDKDQTNYCFEYCPIRVHRPWSASTASSRPFLGLFCEVQARA
jgi:hypothetical protein